MTVWIAVEPPLRGSPPAIVIGYVTPFVGSVYWNDQCGIVHNAYGDQHCPPNTWHWDNVSITPAVPYSVIPSNPADLRLSSEAPSNVSFAAPAPENASLSFVSFGDTPQLAVSYDGGLTWLPPKFQEATAFDHPEVERSLHSIRRDEGSRHAAVLWFVERLQDVFGGNQER